MSTDHQIRIIIEEAPSLDGKEFFIGEEVVLPSKYKEDIYGIPFKRVPGNDICLK